MCQQEGGATPCRSSVACEYPPPLAAPPPRPSPVTICPSHPILTEGMGSNDGPTPRWGSPVGPLEVVVVAFSEFDYLSDFFLEEPFLHYFCIQLRVEVPCYPPPLCSPGPVCTNHQVLHMQAVPPVVPLTLRHILSWGPSPPPTKHLRVMNAHHKGFLASWRWTNLIISKKCPNFFGEAEKRWG